MKKVYYDYHKYAWMKEIVQYESDQDLFNTYFDYPCIKSSLWFKEMTRLHPNLPKEVLNAKSNKEHKTLLDRFVNTINKKYFAYKTAKSCPAIVDQLSHCLLMKAPCDFEINFSNNDIEFDVANPNMMAISYHPPVQYVPEQKSKSFKTPGHIFKGYVNAKIVFPFVFKTNMPSLFLDPFYHNPEPPLKVVQGAFMGEYTKNHTFQINTFGKANSSVTYKKGDPIAYLWYPHRVKFERSKKTLSIPIIRNFNGRLTTEHFK